MKPDRAIAERILAQHVEWVGPYDLDSPFIEWGVEDGVLAVFHPMSDSTWMGHVAAERGTPGAQTVTSLLAIDRWFRRHHSDVKKLIGFVRADNDRCLRMCGFMGFEREGTIKDYYFKNGQFYDIVVVGRRQ